MRGSRTNLDYLMSLLNIRGVEIARRLHIDQSLVGKWKNGTRKLSPASSYIDTLAELFCEFGRDRIDALFSELYRDSYDPDQITDFIKAFLCSADPELMAKTALHKDIDADSSALYYSYNGLSGRKKVMDYLFSCAGNSDTAVTIYLYDSMCFDWLISDADYFREFGKYVTQTLSDGSDIYLIIDSDSDRERAARLLSYLYPFSANKRFNIYYTGGVNYPTMYIIGGMLAAVGYNDFRGDSFMTQVFTDHPAVRQQELYMRRLLKNRKKSSIRRLSAFECFENVKNLSVISSDIYMFSAIPTIFSMPTQLLERVISYNGGISDDMKERIREYNRLSSGEFFKSGVSVRCLFSLEALTEAANREYVIYRDNMYYDAPLYIKSEDFFEHLEYIVRMMEENGDYSVGLIPKIELFGALFSKLGYFACKRNCWALMSNDHSGQKALFLMNSSLVELIFKAQEYSWKDVPEAYINRQNVIGLIRGLRKAGERE